MTNITRIPVQDNYSTTLTAKLTASATDLTIYVKAAPSYTPTSTATRAVINPGKTNMEVVNISSYDSSAKTFTIPASGRAQDLKEGVTATVQEHASGSIIMISDNFKFWEDIQDAVATKADIAGQVFTGQVSFSGTTHGGIKVNSLTTTQRDALSSPGDGLIIYNTTAGEFQVRQGSAWSAMASGSTQPDASQTVAGKVEMATDAETIAGTTSGGTGAQLAVNPGNLLSTTVSKQTSAGVADAGKFVRANAGAGVVDSTFMPYASTVTEVNKLSGASANVTAANLNTLTAGSSSDASALHTHNIDNFTVTAGENINGSTTPVAAFISKGTTSPDTFPLQVQETENDTSSTASGVNYRAQTFTTGAYQNKITQFDLLLRRTVVAVGNITVNIYAVDGSSKPTGASLGTANFAAGSLSTAYQQWATFSITMDCTPATEYAIRLIALADTVNWSTGNGNTYTTGQPWQSADAGGTWTSPGADDFAFRVWGYESQTAGRLYTSDANEAFRGMVDGFVTSNTLSGASATFKVSGKLAGFTALTAGSVYYLSNTLGTIDTSGNGLKVGQATSTTELNIDFLGGLIRKTVMTSPSLTQGNNSVEEYYNVSQCGFKASRVKIDYSIFAQVGAVGNVRTEMGSAEYITSLYGAVTNAGNDAAFIPTVGLLSNGSSVAVTDGTPSQTVTLGTFSLTHNGLTCKSSTNDVAGSGGSSVQCIFHR